MSRVIDYSGVNQKENRVVFKTRFGGRRVMDHVFAGEHQAVPYGIRLIFYIITTALLMQSIIFFIKYLDADLLFSENGFLEWAQIFMLLLCVILLNLVANRMTEIHEGAHVLSFMPLLACVRELDKVLDTYVFNGAWQLIATGLLVYLVYFVLSHRQIIKGQLLRILAIPSTGLFFAGFLTVIVFSRMFGQQSFWQLALQENYLRLVARIAEEGCEIFGYLLLVFGCIELLVFAISCKPDTNHRYQH
jgi:hypothetical protein